MLAIALMILSWNVNPNMWGIHGWDWDPDSVRAYIEEVPFSWARVVVGWGWYNAERGVYNFDGIRRRLLNVKESNLEKAWLNFEYTPLWISRVPVPKWLANGDEIDKLTYRFLIDYMRFWLWPPEEIEPLLEFYSMFIDSLRDLLDIVFVISIYNEPDWVRRYMVNRFHRLYVQQEPVGLGIRKFYSTQLNDSVAIGLIKLSDSEDTLAIIKRICYTSTGDTIRVDTIHLSVTSSYVNFVKDTLWTPGYYAQQILKPSYEFLKEHFPADVDVIMQAPWLNLADTLPFDQAPPTGFEGIEWTVPNTASGVIDWITRFYNAGGYNYTDAINNHFLIYWANNWVDPLTDLPPKIDSVLSVYEELGVLKPLYLGEFFLENGPPELGIASYDSAAKFLIHYMDVFLSYADTTNPIHIHYATMHQWSDRAYRAGLIEWLGPPRVSPIRFKPAFYAVKNYLLGFKTPYLWARDSMATWPVLSPKFVKLNNSLLLFYQSRGLIVSTCFESQWLDTITNIEEGYANAPSVASLNNGILLVYRIDTNRIVCRFKVHGSNWSDPVDIFTSNHLVSPPSLAVQGDTAYCVFVSKENSYSTLYYSIVHPLSGQIINHPLYTSSTIEDPSCITLNNDEKTIIISFTEANRIKTFKVEGGDIHGPVGLSPDGVLAKSPVFASYYGDTFIFAYKENGNLSIEIASYVDTVEHFSKWEIIYPVKTPVLVPFPTKILLFFSRYENSDNELIPRVTNIYRACLSRTDDSHPTIEPFFKSYLNSNYPHAIKYNGKLYVVWTEGNYDSYKIEVDSSIVILPEVKIIKPSQYSYFSPNDSLEVTFTVHPSDVNYPVIYEKISVCTDKDTFVKTFDKEIRKPLTLSANFYLPSEISSIISVKVDVLDEKGDSSTKLIRPIGIAPLTSRLKDATNSSYRKIVVDDEGNMYVLFKDTLDLTKRLVLALNHNGEMQADTLLNAPSNAILEAAFIENEKPYIVAIKDEANNSIKNPAVFFLFDGFELVWKKYFFSKNLPRIWAFDASISNDSIYIVLSTTANDVYLIATSLEAQSTFTTLISFQESSQIDEIKLIKNNGYHIIYNTRSDIIMRQVKGDTITPPLCLYSSPFFRLTNLCVHSIGDTLLAVWIEGKRRIRYLKLYDWTNEEIGTFYWVENIKKDSINSLYMDRRGKFIWTEARGSGGRSRYFIKSATLSTVPIVIYTSEAQLSNPQIYEKFERLYCIWTEGRESFKIGHTSFPPHYFKRRAVITENRPNIRFKIGPIPAAHFLTIKANENSSDGFCVKLYDTAGRNIFKKKFKNAKKITLNLEWLPSGVYFIEVRQGKFNANQKIIVIH